MVGAKLTNRRGSEYESLRKTPTILGWVISKPSEKHFSFTYHLALNGGLNLFPLTFRLSSRPPRSEQGTRLPYSLPLRSWSLPEMFTCIKSTCVRCPEWLEYFRGWLEAFSTEWNRRLRELWPNFCVTCVFCCRAFSSHCQWYSLSD